MSSPAVLGAPLKHICWFQRCRAVGFEAEDRLALPARLRDEIWEPPRVSCSLSGLLGRLGAGTVRTVAGFPPSPLLPLPQCLKLQAPVEGCRGHATPPTPPSCPPYCNEKTQVLLFLWYSIVKSLAHPVRHIYKQVMIVPPCSFNSQFSGNSVFKSACGSL